MSKNSRRPATRVCAAAVDRQPLAVSHRTASKENGGPLAHGQWLSEIGIPAAPFDDPEPLELSNDQASFKSKMSRRGRQWSTQPQLPIQG